MASDRPFYWKGQNAKRISTLGLCGFFCFIPLTMRLETPLSMVVISLSNVSVTFSMPNSTPYRTNTACILGLIMVEVLRLLPILRPEPGSWLLNADTSAKTRANAQADARATSPRPAPTRSGPPCLWVRLVPQQGPLPHSFFTLPGAFIINGLSPHVDGCQRRIFEIMCAEEKLVALRRRLVILEGGALFL